MPPSHLGDNWADQEYRASSKIIDPVSSKVIAIRKKFLNKKRDRGPVTHTQAFFHLQSTDGKH